MEISIQFDKHFSCYESNGKFHRDEKYWKTDTGYIDPMRPNVFERPFPSEIALDKNKKTP